MRDSSGAPPAIAGAAMSLVAPLVSSKYGSLRPGGGGVVVCGCGGTVPALYSAGVSDAGVRFKPWSAPRGRGRIVCYTRVSRRVSCAHRRTAHTWLSPCVLPTLVLFQCCRVCVVDSSWGQRGVVLCDTQGPTRR